jgi:hypothetical protein
MKFKTYLFNDIVPKYSLVLWLAGLKIVFNGFAYVPIKLAVDFDFSGNNICRGVDSIFEIIGEI